LKEIIKKDKEQGKLKTLKLGCDIGGGGDYNVYVLRYRNFAIICGYNKSNDTMTNVAEIERIIKELSVKYPGKSDKKPRDKTNRDCL